ncbi:hypothetical protein [Photobacterium damselae]|uniref:hypothetical protein n=1 Tax=Photobacterium damselae TaxID=38293 RepID=UPI0012AD36DC|nr:hypothetical protein [Photobacterium damselae]MCG9706423.1 hypothetical protein [Photobacterium damselae]
MLLGNDIILFFEQWERLAQALLQQGVNYTNSSTRKQLQHWQQQAGLLGFSMIETLCTGILHPTESLSSAQAFGQLIYQMEALQKAAIKLRME